MGKKLKPEYMKRLNMEESKQISELIKSKDYSSALSLASVAIRRNKNNDKELGIFQELRLRALLGLRAYDKVVDLAIEYAYKFKERQFEFLTLELKAKIYRGNGQDVLDELPSLFSLYPSEQVNLEFIKIDALICLEKYKEAFDEISNCSQRYPAIEKSFLNKRIKVYKKAKEYELALLEVSKLEEKYPEDKEEYENERMKILRKQRKLEENKNLKSRVFSSELKHYLELDEHTFMDILKKMGVEEAVFLLSVRYKFQGSTTLSLGCIDEYEKRAKEKANTEFTNYMRKEIKTKKKIFDMKAWTRHANKLGLNFDNLQKDYSSEER